MNIVLDSYALLAFFEKESGYKQVEKILIDVAYAKNNLFLSYVNWGEIYYIVAREYSIKKAEEVAHFIKILQIECVPVDEPIAKQAALFKAQHAISYADCFAAALAKIKQAKLVTGDKEFKAVQKDISILWLTKE